MNLKHLQSIFYANADVNLMTEHVIQKNRLMKSDNKCDKGCDIGKYLKDCKC